MSFDFVHDAQKAYRRLVRAMSFPGTIVDLSPEASRIASAPPFSPTIMLFAFMLLDSEVSFYLSSANSKEDSRLVSELTYARVVPADKARFVICIRGGEPLSRLIEQACVGNLVDPHIGATVIAEVPGIICCEEPEPGICELSGPGIEKKSWIRLEEAGMWLKERNNAVSEFPLGVDLILAEPAGKVVALPRTTRMELVA